MASPRSSLRVVGTEQIGPATRALDVIRTDGAPWSNVRGKYVILDTGLVLPDGKAVKRAYSLTPLTPGEGEASHARLVIKRIGDGPGSGALHAAPVGAESAAVPRPVCQPTAMGKDPAARAAAATRSRNRAAKAAGAAAAAVAGSR